MLLRTPEENLRWIEEKNRTDITYFDALSRRFISGSYAYKGAHSFLDKKIFPELSGRSAPKSSNEVVTLAQERIKKVRERFLVGKEGGQEVHSGLRRALQFNWPTSRDDEAFHPLVYDIKIWLDARGMKLLATDLTIRDPQLGYITQIDLVLSRENHLIFCELKTNTPAEIFDGYIGELSQNHPFRDVDSKMFSKLLYAFSQVVYPTTAAAVFYGVPAKPLVIHANALQVIGYGFGTSRDSPWGFPPLNIRTKTINFLNSRNNSIPSIQPITRLMNEAAIAQGDNSNSTPLEQIGANLAREYQRKRPREKPEKTQTGRRGHSVLSFIPGI